MISTVCQGLLSCRRHIGKREDPGDEVEDNHLCFGMNKPMRAHVWTRNRMHQSAIVLVRCVPGRSLLPPPYWKARRPWGRGWRVGTKETFVCACSDYSQGFSYFSQNKQIWAAEIDNLNFEGSLPADVLWGSFVTHSFLPRDKTVRIFAYSSTREQSNKRCGTRLKTESETGERPYGRVRLARFARIRLLRHALPISLLILRKKPTVLQSKSHSA